MGTERNPDMYMALPGFSLSTFIMNIPQLVRDSSFHTPIIIDRYDWERLRGQIVTTSDDYQAQRLGLMYNQLYQQGLIKLFDYRKYYSPGIQTKNIEQTRELLSSIPDHENQNVAHQAANGFVSYGLGEYQESLRETLDNLDRYLDRRQWVNNEADKLDRGTNDPVLWNERVINQYLAALEVRRKLERELKCDIQCIGQQESGPIGSLLADRTHSELPHTLQHTTSTFTDNFYEFDIEDTTKKRDVADQISTIAQDVVGIKNDHWFVFGPRLALLESGDTYSRARSHIRFNSIDSITTEAKELLSILQARQEGDRSIEFLNYEAEYLIEENELNHLNKRRLLDQLQAETALANYSRDIDDLAEDYSPAAQTIVESILMDPLNRYTHDDVYRKSVNLMRMLENISVSDEQMEMFSSRGAFRRGRDNLDWYQNINRQPMTT